jgi:hypothetical protein
VATLKAGAQRAALLGITLAEEADKYPGQSSLLEKESRTSKYAWTRAVVYPAEASERDAVLVAGKAS